MSKARYLFEKVIDGYEFYDCGVFRLRFQDSSFRSAFEVYASENNFSSQWIGSMLRLFRRKFPVSFSVSKRNDAERFLTRYGDRDVVELLRSMDFCVSFAVDFPLTDLVPLLEARGYVVKNGFDRGYYPKRKKEVQYA